MLLQADFKSSLLLVSEKVAVLEKKVLDLLSLLKVDLTKNDV